MQRRGKLHVHDDIDPRRMALIVVDLQNGFMVPEHTPMPVKTAIGTVPNVNRLAATLRETGGKVFWIQNTTNETSLKEWSNWFAMSRPELVQERIEPDAFVETALGPLASDETRKTIERADSRQQALTLAMMSPEFQRR